MTRVPFGFMQLNERISSGATSLGSSTPSELATVVATSVSQSVEKRVGAIAPGIVSSASSASAVTRAFS